MSADPPAELPSIGIDIGGTSVRAGLIGPDGEVLQTVRGRTPGTVEEAEALLIRMIGDLAALTPVRSAGLAVAGFISADRRRVMYAPHLPWRDTPLPERISAAVGLPVHMDHDVNSAAVAEYELGSARGARSALLIAVGTGIGAGLVVEGRIFRGTHGVAPELGHLLMVPGGRPCPCGKSGCLERYCSGTALAATAIECAERLPAPVLAELTGGDLSKVTGALVGQAARSGDPAASAAVADLAQWLGLAIALAADVFDPERIVIGGGVSRIADLFLPAAVLAARPQITGGAFRPEVEVVAARFGDAAGMIGAARLTAP
ncbi:ROK family protein [Nakamurella silvestris]|nr:ROK family protein [Nakamurella silvestris]